MLLCFIEAYCWEFKTISGHVLKTMGKALIESSLNYCIGSSVPIFKGGILGMVVSLLLPGMVSVEEGM